MSRRQSMVKEAGMDVLRFAHAAVFRRRSGTRKQLRFAWALNWVNWSSMSAVIFLKASSRNWVAKKKGWRGQMGAGKSWNAWTTRQAGERLAKAATFFSLPRNVESNGCALK